MFAKGAEEKKAKRANKKAKQRAEQAAKSVELAAYNAAYTLSEEVASQLFDDVATFSEVVLCFHEEALLLKPRQSYYYTGQLVQ